MVELSLNAPQRDSDSLPSRRVVSWLDDEPSTRSVATGRVIKITPALRKIDDQVYAVHDRYTFSNAYRKEWRERLQLSEENLKRVKTIAPLRQTVKHPLRTRPKRKCAQCDTDLQYKGSLCAVCREPKNSPTTLCPCGNKLRTGRGINPDQQTSATLCHLCAGRARRLPLETRRAYIQARKELANVRCEICDKLLRWDSTSRRCTKHPLPLRGRS